MKNKIDELLTTKAAAKYLCVSPQTLEKWRSQKRGPHFFKLGKKAVRYQKSDLTAFMFGGKDGD